MKNKKHIFYLLLGTAFSILSCTKTQTCPIQEKVSYSSQVSSLIEVHCFKCHAEDLYKEKASRVKIYTYESLKKMGETGQLVGSISHSPGFIAMPFRKGSKIDSCAIEIIKKWVITDMEK